MDAKNTTCRATAPDTFEKELMAFIPRLKKRAMKLTSNNPTRADDLVQNTLVKAWEHRESFEPGTYLERWLFTIVRNEHFNSTRTSRRERRLEAAFTNQIMTGHGKFATNEGPILIEIRQTLKALQGISPELRELLYAKANDSSLEELSRRFKVPTGTVKSRLFRAQRKLRQMMD